MKITTLSPIKYNTNSYNINEKQKTKNHTSHQIMPLFKKEQNISFGAKKISIKAIKTLIESLRKENIDFELLATDKYATVVEFKDSKTLAKSTSFFKDGIKKIINYRPDGTTPHTALQYQNETLQKIITYDINGCKKTKHTFYPSGQRESITTYTGFVNFPKSKKIYYKNGKTIKSEIKYHTNCKLPETIKEFNNKGILFRKSTFDNEGRIISKISYDKKGNAIAHSDFSYNVPV